MQINLLLIIVLTGLFAAYLWRENKILARHMARLTREASTQESSRHYKEIFDNASDAVFVVEVLRRGKFQFESLNHAAVLAICPQGTDLGDYCFDETVKFGNDAGLPLILAELSGQLRGCLATGLPAEYESAFRVSPDGEQKNYRIKLIPMADDGGISHIFCFAQDITERKRVEALLRQNQERLAEAQRIGQMGCWELNLASGVLIWSDEIYRIFEIEPALFDASYEAFLNAIHPDDRETVNNAYAESLENHTPYCIDHRLMFADGRIRHVRECCETHYDDNGKPLYSRGTVQDITALKETEQQLKETQKKLRELVISRESLIEGERKRIAWEMHEELGQQLAAMNLRVCSMRSQLPKSIPSLDENSRIIVGLIDKSIETVREIVSDLRPTALLYGTVAALEWLVAEFNKHPDMVCKLEVDEDGTPVSDELTTLVFRIVQESLENIVRHTGVSSVSVSWTSNRSGQCLAIRHDGKSCSPELTGDKSLSFFGMQERVSAFGGEMKIFDMLERGTVIKVRFRGSRRGGAEIQATLFVE